MPVAHRDRADGAVQGDKRWGVTIDEIPQAQLPSRVGAPRVQLRVDNGSPVIWAQLHHRGAAVQVWHVDQCGIGVWLGETYVAPHVQVASGHGCAAAVSQRRRADRSRQREPARRMSIVLGVVPEHPSPVSPPQIELAVDNDGHVVQGARHARHSAVQLDPLQCIFVLRTADPELPIGLMATRVQGPPGHDSRANINEVDCSGHTAVQW